MNKRPYRESRVRMTERIEKAIYDVLDQEDDLKRKKKRHPAEWYRKAVANGLGLGDSNNPSLRSYEEKIKQFRKPTVQENRLDQPWSIADCFEYDISGDIILLLTRLKSISGDTEITIRRAKWTNLLFSAIDKIVSDLFPGNIEQQEIRHNRIPREYALREKFCEITGREFNTTDLDTLFFVYSDVGEEAMRSARWDNVTFNRPVYGPTEMSANSVAAYEAKLGPLSRHELDVFHGYEEAAARGDVAAQLYWHEHREDMDLLQAKIKASEVNSNER